MSHSVNRLTNRAEKHIYTLHSKCEVEDPPVQPQSLESAPGNFQRLYFRDSGEREKGKKILERRENNHTRKTSKVFFSSSSPQCDLANNFWFFVLISGTRSITMLFFKRRNIKKTYVRSGGKLILKAD